ncbi:hypothetical protein Avbf_14960 [Armadillidium vulgare]|nr:hypothetical protein Avbf_14960 [Armadillidium vulgare]
MEGRKGVSQRIRQVQGQSFTRRAEARVRYKICYILKICQCVPFGLAALFELVSVSEIILKNVKIEDELNGGDKFIIFLIDEAIKTYVPLRKLKTNINKLIRFSLTLTSTFDDMRCTLLRLFGKS